MGMNESTTGRLYDLWSKVYDWTFGLLVAKRQVRAIEQMRLGKGDRVLDVGVGTGLMLPFYPRDVNVVGLDISEGMLSRAQEKCLTRDLTYCRLLRADAMRPPLTSQSFDYVMVSHAISVVSDPARLLGWAGRLLKPGGRIVLLNHFQSTQPVIAWFEQMLNPVFMKLGWRSDLSLEVLLRDSNLDVEYCFRIGAIDIWKIAVLKPNGDSVPAEALPKGEVAIGYGR